MSEADDPGDLSGEKEVETMRPEQAAEHLRVIRELMERPLKQTTRSGVSGLIAGVLALAGCGATWYAGRLGQLPEASWIKAIGLVWAGVLVLAVAANLLLTWRRAHRQGLPLWGRSQNQTALAIAPGFIVGALVSWALVGAHQYHPVAFAWIVFYGMAVWSLGLFGPLEVKLLGAGFFLAGILGFFFFAAHPLAALAVTFGGMHLVYGIVVWVRHGG
ncbi:MAG: hypothetical protein GWP05_11160 [Anaerolineaceae bacterium]|nr:hypothetical protein [Anaerolineaceae bacterium]